MKTIYLVTHGPTEKNVPDPGMTNEGLEMVRNLRTQLATFLPPEGPTQIHVGTGRRQWQIVQTLGFSHRENLYVSDFWGGAATVTSTKEVILLGHGLQIPREKYLTIAHLQPFYSQTIAGLPDKSLICSGRPVLVRLGMQEEDCSSGSLYALHVQDNGQIKIELLIAGVCLIK